MLHKTVPDAHTIIGMVYTLHTKFHFKVRKPHFKLRKKGVYKNMVKTNKKEFNIEKDYRVI